MSESRLAEAEALLAAAAPRRVVLEERGVEIALLDWRGAGPLLLLHHANGFCKGVWGQVAEALRHDFRVIALDARGHGDSSRPEGSKAFAWREFAADLAAVAGRLAAEQPDGRIALGVGHSFGGTSLLGAASLRPGLFARCLLLDPVIPPPPSEPLSIARRQHIHALVEAARNRRAAFPSREAARVAWARHPFFRSWDPLALALYLADGFAEHADGSVALKCAPAVEAAVFAQGNGFDALALARACKEPTLVVHAEAGNFPRAVMEALVTALPDGRLESAPCGHLIPMERPDLAVGAVRRFAAAKD